MLWFLSRPSGAHERYVNLIKSWSNKRTPRFPPCIEEMRASAKLMKSETPELGRKLCTRHPRRRRMPHGTSHSIKSWSKKRTRDPHARFGHHHECIATTWRIQPEGWFIELLVHKSPFLFLARSFDNMIVMKKDRDEKCKKWARYRSFTVKQCCLLGKFHPFCTSYQGNMVKPFKAEVYL